MNRLLEAALPWLGAIALLAVFIRLIAKESFFKGGGSFTSQASLMDFMNQDQRKSLEYVHYQQEVEPEQDDQGEINPPDEGK